MSSDWIRRLGPPACGEAQLVCFPHAGGAANAYTALAHTLSPTIEVFGVQYPGRQDRRGETPIDDLLRLADLIAAETQLGFGNEKPYAFFGHSMGALVAFETATRIRGTASSGGPVHLFLSGRAAPSLGARPSDFLRSDEALISELRRLGGADAGILDDPEMVDMIIPAVRADYRALMEYFWTPGALLDCPFTVLIGDEDPIVTPDEAMEWCSLSAARTEMMPFPGGHFYLNDQAQQVAEVITGALAPPGADPAVGWWKVGCRPEAPVTW